MVYYKLLLELPKIPEDMEAELFHLTTQREIFIKNSQHTNQFYTKRDNRPGQIQSFPKIELTEGHIYEWLRENIHAGGTAYQLLQNVHEGTHFWPHVDRTRKWALFYLLQSGGDPHTVFYRTTDGSPTHPAQTWPDYDNLTEVDRIQIPLRTWTLLSVTHPHSVEGIDGTRIDVQIAFDDCPIEL